MMLGTFYDGVMSIGTQFNEWRAMVSQAAARGLSPRGGGVGASVDGERGVMMALPAARLLLGDDESEHAGLIRAMRQLADVGRPWLNIGVNVGTLSAQTDNQQARAARAAIDALLQSHSPRLAGGNADIAESADLHAGSVGHPRLAGGNDADIAESADLRAGSVGDPRQAGGNDADIAESADLRAGSVGHPRQAGGYMRFPVTLADAAGHTRDVYHPLAVHLCLAAFHRRYESIHPSLWSAGEQAILEMVAPLRLVEHFTDACPPAGLVPLVLWQALGLAEQAMILSRDIDLEMVDSAVQAIVGDGDGGTMSGGPGALHGPTETDTLDTWTYRELTGLHALAALALKRRNGAWAKRVEQVAAYHLENTQPDNATNQPWGLFAFVWPVKTQSFAEQQLHDATTHAGGTVDPLAAMLLADAADCLAEFG